MIGDRIWMINRGVVCKRQYSECHGGSMLDQYSDTAPLCSDVVRVLDESQMEVKSCSSRPESAVEWTPAVML